MRTVRQRSVVHSMVGSIEGLLRRTGLPQLQSPRVRRITARAILGAAGLCILVPGALWVHYRWVYVVSRNALVKGYIADVGAEIDGVVTTVDVDAGQRVTAGQVLVSFEDRQLQAELQRAQSQLEKALRELQVEGLAIAQERRRLHGRVSETEALAAAARAQTAAAESQADEASSRYETRNALAQQGIITQEELRTAAAARNTAKALGETAKAEQGAAAATHRLASVEFEGLAVRERHVEVLESEVAAFRASVAVAEANVKATIIRAPEDGWVVRRIAQPGGSVTVGQPIISLWIGKDVWVEAWIEENDLGSVAVGNAAKVNLKSYPDREFSGVVETVAVSTDYEVPEAAVPEPRRARIRASPVVCVRVRLDNPEGLFPGLSAVVGIRKSKRLDSAVVGAGREGPPVAARR